MNIRQLFKFRLVQLVGVGPEFCSPSRYGFAVSLGSYLLGKDDLLEWNVLLEDRGLTGPSGCLSSGLTFVSGGTYNRAVDLAATR